MANSPIRLLPAIQEIGGADLFVLEQNGKAMKLSGAKLTEFIDRQVMDVKVHGLSAISDPTASYDRITGKLELGIPKGNSIVSISLNSEDKVVFKWADGSTVDLDAVRGETGMSAYQYAVENGYTGSEIEFAELQVNLYNASLNEDERVQAEAKRKSDYANMMARLDNKLAQLDQIENRLECSVAGTTLVINTIGVTVVDTTLMF